MGLKAQLGWLRNGPERTNAALEALGVELRELQAKVQVLGDAVERLESGSGSSIEAMRGQLRSVTDDLGDRVGVITARLDTSG